MPDLPSMPMQQLIWMGLVAGIVFVAGAFFVALSKSLQERFTEKFFKAKRKPNGNGNGGMTHEQAEAMIKALNDNGTKLDKGLEAIMKSQEKMSEVILATDEDMVHKVHNKPSIERTIREIWDRVKTMGRV